MKEVKPIRHIRRHSPPVTPEMAAQMRTMVTKLGMMQHDVAAYFGVNPGRVSEVVNGHTFVDVPPAPLSRLTYLQ
ncbi:hypothetical protein [Hyphococcus luteus]|uniref:Uncharacterized protein n=1 Tax=Hyphococcus luteus TaxID=2058213 RepID=A0A2S7K5I7_9PROT|nr:hypothetical protein [Marinicaulis flavus]PQA87736.1 hypothetical protein CW354_05075 [Marinicaulis flavus]